MQIRECIISFFSKLCAVLLLIGVASEISASPLNQYRTSHLNADGVPIYTNSLVNENSPYLQQHAHNPVNWYPWGEAAFTAAKTQDKPVFLSIGYSTCHWCHVMEEESFDDLEVASLLNEHFIAIKVDREELPDVDAAYMQAIVLLNGSGGWPSTSILNADGQTFIGGTYFSKPQLLSLLRRVSLSWNKNRRAIEQQAIQIAGMVNQNTAHQSALNEPLAKIVKQQIVALTNRFDVVNGGFVGTQKFPSESALLFLLDVYRRQGSREIGAFLKTTLDKMAFGGIYDHIGGGFHRYSTDPDWKIPHFEKMLYTQALMADVYLSAYQISKSERYKRIAEQTLDYVLRDMRNDDGVFYAATDAGGKGQEGRYFTWGYNDLKMLLTMGDFSLLTTLFDISENGNFSGANVLRYKMKPERYAKLNHMTETNLYNKLDVIINMLLNARQERAAPHRDEKIIVSWNALLIRGLIKASILLDRADYIDYALAAARELWSKHYIKNGHLLKRIQVQGRVTVNGNQEDYALLADAFVDIYDVTEDFIWLERALKLTNDMLEKFSDKQSGGLFMGELRATPLLVRTKNYSDNELPSGNGVALRLLNRLLDRTNNELIKDARDRLVASYSALIEQQRVEASYFSMGLNEVNKGSMSIVRYLAQSHIKVSLKPVTKNTNLDEYRLLFKIDDGWHINSDQPLQAYLKPTKLQVINDASVEDLQEKISYPEPVKKKLGFSEDALSLFENSFEIKVLIDTKDNKNKELLTLKLQLQACSDRICLLPETTEFNLFPNEGWK